MAPAEVTDENTPQVFPNFFGIKHVHRCKYKFKVGNTARISKVREVFDKKYEQTFTDELFTVDQHIPCFPPIYKLKDYDGELTEVPFKRQNCKRLKWLLTSSTEWIKF